MYANQVSPLVSTALSLALLVPWAARGAHAEEPTPPGDSAPQTARPIYWSTIWYLRGTSAFDGSTMVEGGAVGSAALVHLHSTQGYTEWFLIDGQYLRLSTTNPPLVLTFPPISDANGNLRAVQARSCAGAVPDPAVEADEYELTQWLVNVYKRTYWTAEPARHAPFLVGRGWPGDQGASFSQAQEVLRSLDLRWSLAPNSPPTGHVTRQNPPGGRELSKNAVVILTLDGSTAPARSPLVGTKDAPQPVPDLPAGQDLIADITPEHGDVLLPTCQSTGREYCFRLPASAAGALVTVTQAADYSDNITLSAWEIGAAPPVELQGDNGVACDSGASPRICFRAAQDPQRSTCVAVELRDLKIGRVHIHMAWRPEQVQGN